MFARGKEAYNGVKTFAENESKAVAKNGFKDGAAAYNKAGVQTQQKLLTKFGIDSTR